MKDNDRIIKLIITFGHIIITFQTFGNKKSSEEHILVGVSTEEIIY